MNYYYPREIRGLDGRGTGLYHYTCENDGRIWPVGYCAQGCPGHQSDSGAREHYHQYELDTAKYDGYSRDAQHKCEVCGEWTQGVAYMGAGFMEMHYLCDAHRNREGLVQVSEPHDSVSSY